MQTFLLACYICLQLTNISDLTQSSLGKRDASCDQCLTSLFEKSELLSHIGTSDPLSKPQTQHGLLAHNPTLRVALEERLMKELSQNPFKAESQPQEKVQPKMTSEKQHLKSRTNFDEILASAETRLNALHEKAAKDIQKKSEEVTQKIQQLQNEFETFAAQQRETLLKQLTEMKDSMIQEPKATNSDTLKNGARLMAGESLESLNGHYKATMRNNGELVITDRQGNMVKRLGYDRSRTTRANHHLAMQVDGNLVIYNNHDLSAIWHSSTYNPGEGAHYVLKLEGNGQLAIYAEKGRNSRKIWDSDNFARRPRVGL